MSFHDTLRQLRELGLARDAAAAGMTIEAYRAHLESLEQMRQEEQGHCESCQLWHEREFDCSPGAFSRYGGGE